jgi:hypothetical protein
VLFGAVSVVAAACSGDGDDTARACEVLGSVIAPSESGDPSRIDIYRRFVDGDAPTVVSVLALTVDTVGPISSARTAFDVVVALDRGTTRDEWEEITATIASLPGVEQVELATDEQIVHEYEAEFGSGSRVAAKVAAQLDPPAASAEIRVAGDPTITERLELLANGDERIVLVDDLGALRASVARALGGYVQGMIDPVLDEVDQLAALDFEETASAEALVGLTLDSEADLDAVRDDVDRLIGFADEQCGLAVPPPS